MRLWTGGSVRPRRGGGDPGRTHAPSSAPIQDADSAVQGRNRADRTEQHNFATTTPPGYVAGTGATQLQGLSRHTNLAIAVMVRTSTFDRGPTAIATGWRWANGGAPTTVEVRAIAPQSAC